MFYVPKGGLLQAKRRPFGTPFASACKPGGCRRLREQHAAAETNVPRPLVPCPLSTRISDIFCTFARVFSLGTIAYAEVFPLFEV